MIYIKKDITTVTYGIIPHGCNCMGKMGSGVAKALRDKWPIIFETYSNITPDKKLLGTTMIINISRDLWVANCFTQVFYGYGGIFADADAIKQCLDIVFRSAVLYGIPVFMPKIGSGLGGLSWNDDVCPIIKELENRFDTVTVYICEL